MSSSSAAAAVPAVPAARPIIYLGMDVHKESITFAVLPADAKTPIRVDRLPNDLVKLKRWLERVAAQGEVRACYETSGAGYVLHRAMREWGYACDVIAPSLIPKFLGVTARNVQLALDHSTVVARTRVRSLTLTLLAVPDTLMWDTREVVCEDELSGLTFLRPTLDHLSSAILYESLFHR